MLVISREFESEDEHNRLRPMTFAPQSGTRGLHIPTMIIVPESKTMPSCWYHIINEGGLGTLRKLVSNLTKASVWALDFFTSNAPL